MSRPLRLDLAELWGELSAANTLVVSDRQAGTRLRRIINGPLKWAERLPDPAYQNFVIRWTALETSLRRVFGSK